MEPEVVTTNSVNQPHAEVDYVTHQFPFVRLTVKWPGGAKRIWLSAIKAEELAIELEEAAKRCKEGPGYATQR